MGTRGLSFLKAHVDMVGRGLLNRFLHGNMAGVVASFWVLFCNLLFFVFGSVGRFISRIQAAKNSEEEKSSCVAFLYEDDGTDSEGREIENREHNEGVTGSCKDEEGSVFVATASSKYQFCTGRDISGFVEQPKIMSFTVQEVFVGSGDDYAIHSKDLDAGHCAVKGFGEDETEAQEPIKDSLEKDGFVQSIPMDEFHANEVRESLMDHQLSEKAEVLESEDDFLDDEAFLDEEEMTLDEDLDNKVREKLMDHQLSEKAEVLESEDDFLDDDAFLDEEEMLLDDLSSEPDQVDPELESICSDDGIVSWVDSSSTNTSDAQKQQHLENCTFNAAIDLNDDERIPCTEEDEMLSETTLDPEAAFAADQPSGSESESDEEYIEVELRKTNFSTADGSSCENPVEDNHEGDNLASNDLETMTANSENSREFGHSQEHSSASDSDDNWDWEHDDIIEQLKMEIKNVRTGGLPTILEESETDSPMVGDSDLKLKPLKIDQKLEHKDLLQEIQKVYKGYAEKTRKLDILNYQTLHAIGLLQLKDPLNSNKSCKVPMQSWTNRLRRPKIDSVAESMVALHGDLEMVYIGHACLSWEILQWQYGKAWEMREFDHGRSRCYNQAAGEFQLLQVLLRRFIEDEPFQGPRIEYYVKNRCVLRGLLQVPAIRDDSSRDSKGKAAEEGAISIEKLVEIIEESMRVFWDFIRADRYEPDGGLKQSQLNQQDSAESVLMTALRTQLQKKERKLKDIVRSGNCIVKKFHKPRNPLDPVILLAQVELRLVSRVLSMRKVTRDQLVWCRDKLDRINIISRKVFVEPSFLLFPC